MGNKAKDIRLLIFITLTIIAFMFAFNGNIKADRNKKLFEKEMAFRLDMEEKLSKIRNEKINLITVLKDRELEIKRNTERINSLNNIISEKNKEIENLQTELEKLNLLKEKLEDNLKEELSKKSRSR